MTDAPAWPGEPGVRQVLKAAAERFREYERHHAAKPDAEKAARNAEMAEMCERAMAMRDAEVAQREREDNLRGWEEAISFALIKVSHPIMEEVERVLDVELARRRAEPERRP